MRGDTMVEGIAVAGTLTLEIVRALVDQYMSWVPNSRSSKR